MKRVVMTVGLLLSIHFTKAQANLLGVWPVSVPLSYINFYDNDSISVDTTGIWGNVYRHINSSAIILNQSNELLFQCNGCKIANKQGITIENGDSLVDDKFYNSFGHSGISITQGAIALPRDADTWWVFNYSYSDSGRTVGIPSPDQLYGNIVDIKANGGGGKVIAKKIPLYKGIMGDCRLTACRHANGRDWWLMNHGWNNNVFNKWLATPDSIYGPYKDSVGTLHREPDLYGMAQFTQDGTKYGMGSENGLVNIFDFDRCSGEFSNLRTINAYVEPPWQSGGLISTIMGLCFSPSGRFVYLSGFKYLLQYDTQADTIDSTRALIAKYDTSYSNTEPFFLSALSPQNKIIVSNLQGGVGSPYHVIESPDSGGLACGFMKEVIAIPGSYDNNCLPNVVNLKLGAMVGSGCDTITTDIRHETQDNRQMQMQVFPNPANEVLYIEEHELKSKGTLEIYDAMGRRVYVNKGFDEATGVRVKEWGEGLYFYSLKTKAKDYSGKFIVYH